MAVFEAAEVTAAPIYDAEQLRADEHLQARGTFVAVDDPDFGPDDRAGARRPAERDARARSSTSAGRLGADNEAVYSELLGLDADRLAALRAAGVI